MFGGVAQLGERTVRIRKVESSILFVSTIKKVLKPQGFQDLFLFVRTFVKGCFWLKSAQKAHNFPETAEATQVMANRRWLQQKRCRNRQNCGSVHQYENSDQKSRPQARKPRQATTPVKMVMTTR